MHHGGESERIFGARRWLSPVWGEPLELLRSGAIAPRSQTQAIGAEYPYAFLSAGLGKGMMCQGARLEVEVGQASTLAWSESARVEHPLERLAMQEGPASLGVGKHSSQRAGLELKIFVALVADPDLDVRAAPLPDTQRIRQHGDAQRADRPPKAGGWLCAGREENEASEEGHAAAQGEQKLREAGKHLLSLSAREQQRGKQARRQREIGDKVDIPRVAAPVNDRGSEGEESGACTGEEEQRGVGPLSAPPDHRGQGENEGQAHAVTEEGELQEICEVP